MKVIILGLKHDKDYYAFYGKNFATYDLGIKSRKLKLGYPVNTKLVSLFPYNTFSDLDIENINDPSYQPIYLYADVKVTNREQKEMSGDLGSCLLKNKQVKLLGEATNPYYDLINKKNMFINDYFDDCLYDVLTWDFPLFCNEDNQEDFKTLIRQYLKRGKYSSDFSITDANFRLFPFLVNLSQDYKITFGEYGENTVQGSTIIDYYQSHKLTLKEFRILVLGYLFLNDSVFSAAIKIAIKQGLIDRLGENDKVRLYNSLGEPEDHKASFIKDNLLDINDLFKAKYRNYKNNDKEDLKLLKDKTYQPEEEDDYFGDDYEDSWFSEDLQQDTIDDLFTWYAYLDKQLMAKITKNYAPRVKEMLKELKNERL